MTQQRLIPGAVLVSAILVSPLAAVADDEAGAGVQAGGAEAKEQRGFWSRLFGLGVDSDEAADAEAKAQGKARADTKAGAQVDVSAGAKAQGRNDAAGDTGDLKRADPATRGEKTGWKEGMPPGQAKKAGTDAKAAAREKGMDKKKAMKEKGPRDRDGAVTAEAAGEDVDAQSGGKQPATAEEVLREAAKDKAVQTSGVAEGSAEAEVIRNSTDILIDKSTKKTE